MWCTCCWLPPIIIHTLSIFYSFIINIDRYPAYSHLWPAIVIYILTITCLSFSPYYFKTSPAITKYLKLSFSTKLFHKVYYHHQMPKLPEWLFTWLLYIDFLLNFVVNYWYYCWVFDWCWMFGCSLLHKHNIIHDQW